jgi:hypothetical protein
MAVTTITGAQCTVTYNSVAYSAQVVSGTITATYSVSRTKTLSDTAYPLLDVEHEVSMEFFHDDESAGFIGVLNTAAIAGTGQTLTIAMSDSKWSGTMYVTAINPSFAATEAVMASVTLIGSLTLSDVP